MTTESDKTPTVARRRIVTASACALIGAVIILLTAVLPAEYGYDPLGTGEALGLTALNSHQTGVLHEHRRAWQGDTISFQLAPFEAVEYKYRLAADNALLFGWEATAEVLYDFHAEPDDAEPGYAETFTKTRSTRQSGSYVAPFSGIHGWFWQNRGDSEVTITLRASGFFQETIELRDGQTFYYRVESSRRRLQP